MDKENILLIIMITPIFLFMISILILNIKRKNTEEYRKEIDILFLAIIIMAIYNIWIAYLYNL